MRPWFEHIEHVVPHLIVPVGEEQTSTRKRPTRKSHVQYRFHINALQFAPMFTTLLEDALIFNLRNEDATYVCFVDLLMQCVDLLQSCPMISNRMRKIWSHLLLLLTLIYPSLCFAMHSKSYDDQYINVHRVTVMMNAVLQSLGIKDAYNFFILNPSRPVKGDEDVYGYRYVSLVALYLTVSLHH
jgi:hypothetical protein